MTNFDVDNEEELYPGNDHDYTLLPKKYDIEKNRSSNTYDQFLSLRDVLVYSKKTYS